MKNEFIGVFIVLLIQTANLFCLALADKHWIQMICQAIIFAMTILEMIIYMRSKKK